MLDHMATVAQARELLEPIVRGCVLRSVAQWLISKQEDQPLGNSELLSELIAELMADPEFSL